MMTNAAVATKAKLNSRLFTYEEKRHLDSITIDSCSSCGRTAYVNKMRTNLAGHLFCAKCAKPVQQRKRKPTA